MMVWNRAVKKVRVKHRCRDCEGGLEKDKVIIPCSIPPAFSNLQFMNFWAKGGISLSTTQFIGCGCFLPCLLPRNYFYEWHGCVDSFAIFVISPHWHSPEPEQNSESTPEDSASDLLPSARERRYLLCWFFLPTQLVIQARITQFLYHINCSQPLEPCLTSCLDVYKKAMKFHTPPSGSSRAIHPENRTGYAKDWVWKHWQSCRAGRESWHLFHMLTVELERCFSV